jgi:hypothetical protein
MLRAREVLSDCELALKDFEAAGPTPYWRTRWTALVALLRAVGHVLDKIDAARGGELKEAIAQAWAELNKTNQNHAFFGTSSSRSGTTFSRSTRLARD